VIFVLALLPRVLLASFVSVRPVWDGAIYERAAAELAHGRGYTQRALRADAPLRPSAYYPVGWPAALAAARVLRESRATDIALQFVCACLTSIATYFAARRYASRKQAYRAGVAVALWPSLLLTSYSWMSETLFTLLLVAAMLPLARTRRRWRFVALPLAGLLLGAASLVRPVALGIGALLFLSQVRWKTPRSIVPAALGLAAMLIPIAPWAVRNANVLDAPALISTNGGTNLLVGTLPDGRFERIPRDIDCPNGLREVARDRCRRDVAVARIANDKIGFVLRACRKLIDTFAYETSAALAFADSTVDRTRPRPTWSTALAAASSAPYVALLALLVFQMFRKAMPASASLRKFVLSAFIATAFVHAATLGGDRYHLPLVPLVLVWCASAWSTRTRSAQ